MFLEPVLQIHHLRHVHCWLPHDPSTAYHHVRRSCHIQETGIWTRHCQSASPSVAGFLFLCRQKTVEDGFNLLSYDKLVNNVRCYLPEVFPLLAIPSIMKVGVKDITSWWVFWLLHAKHLHCCCHKPCFYFEFRELSAWIDSSIYIFFHISCLSSFCHWIVCTCRQLTGWVDTMEKLNIHNTL